MPPPQSPPDGAARYLGGLFGFIFAGIGLTVIFFLWTADGFGAPPLFFRIFGTFIALSFIGMGSTFFYAAIKGPQSLRNAPNSTTTVPLHTPASGAPAAPSASTYTCPACGARLGENADVSPKGDVKCGYCRKWFNIQG